VRKIDCVLQAILPTTGLQTNIVEGILKKCSRIFIFILSHLVHVGLESAQNTSQRPLQKIQRRKVRRSIALTCSEWCTICCCVAVRLLLSIVEPKLLFEGCDKSPYAACSDSSTCTEPTDTCLTREYFCPFSTNSKPQCRVGTWF